MTRHPERYAATTRSKERRRDDEDGRSFFRPSFRPKTPSRKHGFQFRIPSQRDASENPNRALLSPPRGSFIATSGSGSQWFNPPEEELFERKREECNSIWKWNSATEMNVFVSRVIIESSGWYPGSIGPRIRRGYTNLGTAGNLSDDRIWKSSFPDKLIPTALYRPLEFVDRGRGHVRGS